MKCAVEEKRDFSRLLARCPSAPEVMEFLAEECAEAEFFLRRYSVLRRHAHACVGTAPAVAV